MKVRTSKRYVVLYTETIVTGKVFIWQEKENVNYRTELTKYRTFDREREAVSFAVRNNGVVLIPANVSVRIEVEDES